MAHTTMEICNLLAKGQLRSGLNPLAVLDGLMSGSFVEAVVGGTNFSVTSAMYAKGKKLHIKTKTLPMDSSVSEMVTKIKYHTKKLEKNLLSLTEVPTDNPYIAYYNKGSLFSNPTVVVVEVQKAQGASEILLTAFTTKVGFVRSHSCNVAMKKFTNFFRQ